MLGTFALKLVVFWSNLPSLLSMAITGAYYGGSPPDQKNDKTIPLDCAHLAKNATGNSTFQIKTNYISLPSFLNPLRGSIYITWFFQKGSPVPTITTPFLLLRLSELLGRTKEDVFISEIGPERALFSSNYYDVLNCCSFQTLGLMFSHGDRSQISQMKVTDGWGTVCCRHFLDVDGFGFCDRSQLFPNEGDRWVKALLPIWTWEWNSSWKRPEPRTKLWS